MCLQARTCPLKLKIDQVVKEDNRVSIATLKMLYPHGTLKQQTIISRLISHRCAAMFRQV
jgi:hypothetical protein